MAKRSPVTGFAVCGPLSYSVRGQLEAKTGGGAIAEIP